LFFIMQVWVPDLEDACGYVPCKYGMRCTFVAASPEEAFSDLASAAETCRTIAQLYTISISSLHLDDAKLHRCWHPDLPVLVW
jgi:hypothetical protein